MKKRKKILIIVLLLLIVLYWSSFEKFGSKEQTLKNQSIADVNTCPKLNDDFYTYINYDYLTEDKLGVEEFSHSNCDCTEKIEKEKEKIIDELINNKDSIGVKINNFYNSYIKNTEEESIAVLNQYIEKINSSKSIQEFIENAIEVNYELSTDILISPNILFDVEGKSEKYFGLDVVTYDWDNVNNYYAFPEYEYLVRMYKKYNIQILKEYGYSEKEAVEITEKVQKMYKEISRFSYRGEEELLKKGYEVYDFEELQKMIKNIPLDILIKYYGEFVKKTDEIMVADINQLKMIHQYLDEKNLETLKEYAMLKILITYSSYISEDYYNIHMNYICESQNYISSKDYNDKEIAYKQIYLFFKDSVTEKFAEKHFSKKQKEFYEKLIKEEIDVYKIRIKEKDWLTEETKFKAIEKLNNITYTVGIQEHLIKVENKYNINAKNSYIRNVINIKQNLKDESMRQYKIGNITYNDYEMDQLSYNAYYLPNNNRINILLGYIYSITECFELNTNDLEKSYYKILGSIGTAVGHELSHAFDTSGSQYDERGNYINWWNEDDKHKFNSLASKVVKYYNQYEQFGDSTIDENIADLGGMSIVLQIAKNKKAMSEEYKEIFEAYAKSYAEQSTSIFKEYLLFEDEHSPNKNRVNAVLSTFDEFYEVYNITETDEMYVKKENRVAVW